MEERLGKILKGSDRELSVFETKRPRERSLRSDRTRRGLVIHGIFFRLRYGAIVLRQWHDGDDVVVRVRIVGVCGDDDEGRDAQHIFLSIAGVFRRNRPLRNLVLRERGVGFRLRIRAKEDDEKQDEKRDGEDEEQAALVGHGGFSGGRGSSAGAARRNPMVHEIY